jgi:hypothetical protein
MAWVELSVGGFLLGSFLYTAWFTTRFEPAARPGYLLIGAGILLSVATNVVLELEVDASTGYRALTLASYAVAAAGLVLIVRERRGARRRELDR